jgi:hypothetical protein
LSVAAVTVKTRQAVWCVKSSTSAPCTAAGDPAAQARTSSAIETNLANACVNVISLLHNGCDGLFDGF